MLAALVLLATPIDQIQPTRGAHSLDLEWNDAEDRLHGSLRPVDPISGRDLDISIMVGTFQGPDFDGPVTMTLRGEGDTQTRTVKRGAGEKAWFARFVPASNGDYLLDVSFTTTRLKLLHAKFFVVSAPLDRWPW